MRCATSIGIAVFAVVVALRRRSSLTSGSGVAER